MSLSIRRYPQEEIARRGGIIYSRLAPTIEPEHRGKFIAIDIESEGYAIDADEMVAYDNLFARHPDAQPWIVRIGSPYVRRIRTYVAGNRYADWRCQPFSRSRHSPGSTRLKRTRWLECTYSIDTPWRSV